MKRTDPQSRYGRIADLVDLDVLAVRRVTLIGCGSMGQPISDQLARHGVGTRPPGRLRLIDGDTVAARNGVGTHFPESDQGRLKVEVTSEMIHAANGEVNVSYWNQMLTPADIPAVADLAGQSDLLGLFADSFELMLQISDRCADICPQIMAVFGPNADYAEVAFSVPGATPPLSTTMGRRKRESISQPQALGCDTAYVANFAAAVCLRLLLGSAKGSELLPCYTNAPLFVLGLRKSWLFEQEPDDIARTIVRVRVDPQLEGE